MPRKKGSNKHRQPAPDRSHREGVSVTDMARMFATEAKAVAWFEAWLWPTGEMSCLKCGSVRTYRVKSGKPMPYPPPRLQALLFYQERDGFQGLEAAFEDVGVGDLLGDDEFEGVCLR